MSDAEGEEIPFKEPTPAQKEDHEEGEKEEQDKEEQDEEEEDEEEQDEEVYVAGLGIHIQ